MRYDRAHGEVCFSLYFPFYFEIEKHCRRTVMVPKSMKSSKLLQHSRGLLKSRFQTLLQSPVIGGEYRQSFYDGRRPLKQRPQTSLEGLPQMEPPDLKQKVKFKGLETDFSRLSIM